MTDPRIIWPNFIEYEATGKPHEIAKGVYDWLRKNTKLAEPAYGEIILEPMPGIKRIMTKVWNDNERDDDDFLSATCTETGQGITLEAIGFQIRKDKK